MTRKQFKMKFTLKVDYIQIFYIYNFKYRKIAIDKL